MIAVNEMVRPTIKEKPYSRYGITTINSVDKNKDKCTWNCHNSTEYCKDYHVKYLKPYFGYTGIIYGGIIYLLKSTGSYGLANIIFLVILIPFLIWYFIKESLNIQDEINQLKSTP